MNRLAILLSLFLVACGGGAGGPTENKVTAVSQNIECNITTPVTNLALYKGDFTVPTVTQTLNKSIIRSMDLKDLDPWWAKASNNTCGNKEVYLQNVFIEDLNRMQKLGVNQVWIYNYGVWDDFSKPLWSISTSDYVIPDNVVKVIVQEANKRNIKIFLGWNMSNSDKINAWNSLDTSDNMTKETLIKIMNSYEVLIINQAKFAQSIGLSGISADLGSFNPNIIKNNTEFREIYVTKMANIIDKIRAVYNGTIVYGQYDSIIDERIISKIDRMKFVVWLGGEMPSDNISVNTFSNNVSLFISWFYLRYTFALGGKYQNLPIEWLIYGQSTSDFYTKNGYLEDSFCFNSCEQQLIKTDFSIQAIAIAGALEAINNQPFFNSSAVSISNYWHTNEVAPTNVSGNTTFPNISSSIRNKPAEDVVKMWYSGT